MTPGTESLDAWRATGVAFPKIAQPGDPILSTDPNKQLRGFVTRPMVHSGITPPKFEGVMRSPNFRLTKRYVHVRVAGRRSKVNLMVDNFIVIRGPIFDVVELNLDTDQFQWRTIDTQFWPGREAYLDVQDSPMATVSQGAPLDRAVQGWAAFDGYVISDSPVPPQDVKNPLSGMPAADVRAVLLSVATKIGTAGPFAQADMPALAAIDILARRGELTANSQTATVQQWAAIDARTPTAERAPGMADGAAGTDEQVFIRGNHRALGEPAPRLQLAVTFTEKSKIEPAKGSGRAEFARMITSASHPLTARVMVNRLWHHHFGTGLVKTVDDFGIKYVGREHVDHLSSILSDHYKCSLDWTGTRYLGMTIDWDYTGRAVHASMLDYIPEALTRFQHPTPRIPQHQPYPHVKPTYGAKAQYTEDVDSSPPLDKQGKKYVQEVIGTLLYYARCVDSTMLPALGSLATQQANPTQNTKKLVHQLLDYAATHPDAIITYQASDMVLAGHSDASYLSETNARSRAGGHFFMSNNDTIPSNNGAILTISQIIKAVMSSAAEAEIGALYINCKEAIPARHTLEFLGHKQPPTPMQTDNTTALGVVNNNVMKKLKSMDMKYHWL